MAESRGDLLKELKKLQSELNKIEAEGSAITQEQIRRQTTLKKEIVATAKELKKVNDSRLQSLSSEEASMKSISTIYDSLSASQKKTLDLTANTQDRNFQKSMDIMALNRDIANLAQDDEYQRLALMRQRDDLMGQLDGRSRSLIESLREQNSIADNLSNLSEEEVALLEKQKAAADALKSSMQAISETVQTFVSNLASGPGITGLLLIGAGKFAGKLSEVNKELGQVGQGLSGAAGNATILSFAFGDSAGTLKALSAEMGGMEDATFGAQLQTNLMANNLGISGTEAATLSGSLARLNGGSLETAGNLAAGAREFASMNNIPVSQLMGDVAGATEEFALFGKDGGKNILQAAGYAAKLGTNMSTLSGIAEGLLDFENSITKELELGAMLGKNINLDRARQLALEGDLDGMMKETLNSLGGIDAFNKMDYFQKKQTAELLGVSVAELQKMATNQEKAAAMSKTFSGSWSNLTEGIKAAASEYGPKLLEWGGGFLTLSAQAGQTWTAFGGSLKGVGDKLKGIGSKLGGVFGAKGGAASSATKMKPDTSVSDNLNKTAGSKGPKASNLLKGAAAILILSAALFVAAKAFQEFGDVTWPAVALGLGGLVGLAGIAYVLGKAQGEMIKGALAVAILGVALIPFAYAMSLIAGLDIGSVLAAAAGLLIFSAAIFGLGALMMSGVGAVVFGAGLLALAGLGIAMMALGAGLLVAAAGFQAIGGSMGSVVSLISQVKDVLGGMFQYILPIAALSLALVGLAGALTLVGIAGIAALPGLMAVAAVGTIATGVGSLLGIGGEEGGAGGGDSELITEIRGLREDLNNGKVAVYLDGQKVTAGVSRVVSRVGSNSYAT